ncbi:carbohydrate-binding family 9-like protein [bacterium]|nr:carbohydrate-binding family 9-like protein [bacterium]
MTQLPEYNCVKIDKNIIISGKIDDPLWEKAAVIPLNNAVTGEKGRFATEARLLYNDEYLYVAFSCEDDYIWGTKTERDSHIFLEECLEIFLNPAQQPHQYYEVNLSPKNVQFDATIINARTENDQGNYFKTMTEFDVEGLITAVHVDGEVDKPGKGKGVTLEFAIPFTELPGAPNIPPQKGDQWRFNLYRIDSPTPGKIESYSWSRVYTTNFHKPWRFGFLKFN